MQRYVLKIYKWYLNSHANEVLRTPSLYSLYIITLPGYPHSEAWMCRRQGHDYTFYSHIFVNLLIAKPEKF